MGEARNRGKQPRKHGWQLRHEPEIHQKVLVHDYDKAGPTRGRIPSRRTGKAGNLAAATGTSRNPTFVYKWRQRQETPGDRKLRLRARAKRFGVRLAAHYREPFKKVWSFPMHVVRIEHTDRAVRKASRRKETAAARARSAQRPGGAR